MRPVIHAQEQLKGWTIVSSLSQNEMSTTNAAFYILQLIGILKQTKGSSYYSSKIFINCSLIIDRQHNKWQYIYILLPHLSIFKYAKHLKLGNLCKVTKDSFTNTSNTTNLLSSLILRLVKKFCNLYYLFASQLT